MSDLIEIDPVSIRLKRHTKDIPLIQPYFIFKYENHQFQTAVGQQRGDEFVWKDKIVVQKTKDSILSFTLWDDTVDRDNYLFHGTYNFEDLFKKKQGDIVEDVNIYHKDKRAGKLQFRFSLNPYIPIQPVGIQYPVEQSMPIGYQMPIGQQYPYTSIPPPQKILYTTVRPSLVPGQVLPIQTQQGIVIPQQQPLQQPYCEQCAYPAMPISQIPFQQYQQPLQQYSPSQFQPTYQPYQQKLLTSYTSSTDQKLEQSTSPSQGQSFSYAYQAQTPQTQFSVAAQPLIQTTPITQIQAPLIRFLQECINCKGTGIDSKNSEYPCSNCYSNSGFCNKCAGSLDVKGNYRRCLCGIQENQYQKYQTTY